MSNYPILFLDPMIKAVIEGRKTQTRRVITPRNSILSPNGDWNKLCWDGSEIYSEEARPGFSPAYIDTKAPMPFVDHSVVNWDYLHVPYEWAENSTIYRIYPRWEIGDHLWVKETWWSRADESDKTKVLYRATPPNVLSPGCKWKPSIFMPRWASRLRLKISAIRAQRIQEITPNDAVAEGFGAETWNCMQSSIDSFKQYWDFLYAKRGYSWAVNPWCWAYTFRVLP